MTDQRHNFGGNWTDEKVEVVRRYLDAYTTALKNQPFKLLYVDAFAGTGYRSAKGSAVAAGRLPGFPEIDDLAKGSARVALEIENKPFDEFVFIEKSRKRFAGLKGLRDEFSERAAAMRFVNQDANEAIVELCGETDWRRTRAVMFLDPCGMQVEWRTIEAIAKTCSVDLWYLFPHSMGVVRMTPRSGLIREAWQDRLDLVCGETDWRGVFLHRTKRVNLFGEEEESVEKATDVETVESYLLQRLSTVFAGVAGRTGRLTNSKNQCMYLLAFATGNPRGKNIALRIAGHLIDGMTKEKWARRGTV